MMFALVATACLLVPGARAQQAPVDAPVGLDVPVPPVELSVLLETVDGEALGEVEVGEPFHLVLVCEHGADAEVRAATRVRDDVLHHAAGWHLFEEVALPNLRADGLAPPTSGFAPDERLVSRVTYRVAALSLEPFENETGGLGWGPARPLAGLGVEVRSASFADALATALDASENGPSEDGPPPSVRGASPDDGESDALRTDTRADLGFTFVALEPDAAPILRVISMLEEGQERPRPLLDAVARPADDDLGAWTRAAWIGGAAGLVFLLALGVAWRGASTASEAAPPPTRLERLATWRDRIAADEVDLREAAFALVREVRASYADRGAPDDRSATEQQWRGELDEALLARGEREDLDRFLASADRVRYAPELPTRWALEDLVRAAIEVEERTCRADGAEEVPA